MFEVSSSGVIRSHVVTRSSIKLVFPVLTRITSFASVVAKTTRLMLGLKFAQLLLLGLSGVLAFPSLARPSLETRDELCNGYAALCSRSYGNVTYIGGRLSP